VWLGGAVVRALDL